MAGERDSITRPVRQVQGGKEVPEGEPRLPHERDESSDSQQSEPRPVIKKAHDDVAAGRVDTDRGAPAHEAYQKQKTPAKPK